MGNSKEMLHFGGFFSFTFKFFSMTKNVYIINCGVEGKHVNKQARIKSSTPCNAINQQESEKNSNVTEM